MSHVWIEKRRVKLKIINFGLRHRIQLIPTHSVTKRKLKNSFWKLQKVVSHFWACTLKAIVLLRCCSIINNSYGSDYPYTDKAPRLHHRWCWKKKNCCLGELIDWSFFPSTSHSCRLDPCISRFAFSCGIFGMFQTLSQRGIQADFKRSLGSNLPMRWNTLSDQRWSIICLSTQH